MSDLSYQVNPGTPCGTGRSCGTGALCGTGVSPELVWHSRTVWHRRSAGVRVGPASRRCAAVILAALCCAGLAGCSATEFAPARGPTQIFPNADTWPRIAVYGGLNELLPQYDVTPALQMFLYGPDRESRTSLRNPQGMVAAGNLLLVCDQGRPNVTGVDMVTGRARGWCDEDHPPRCPVAIALHAGNVYVADTTLHAVLVYGPKGEFVTELAPTTDPDRKFRPCSLAFANSVLHIGDLGDRQIARWDADAKRWLAPLEPPDDRAPLVAPTGLAFAPDGTLLIVDSVQNEIMRVSATGDWLEPIGGPGRGPGQFVRPKQVCCTPSGLVLVTDAGRQSVLVFREDGRFLTEVHERAEGWRGFTLPAGLLVLPEGSVEAIARRVAERGEPAASEYVLVSDALGGTSVTVLGVMTQGPESQHAP